MALRISRLFPRFVRLWVLLPLLLAGAFTIGRSCTGAVPEPRSRDRAHLAAGDVGMAPVPAQTPEPRKAGGEAKATSSPVPVRASAPDGKVVRVRDGDSIVVMRGGIGIEVRLDGIDCPELAQAFGKKAKGATADFAFGKTVRLVAKGKDRYGRELAEVFLPDGRSLNRELVSGGFAWWYRKYSTDRSLETLEQAARAAHRGLWVDKNPVPPWEFRAGNPRRQGGGG